MCAKRIALRISPQYILRMSWREDLQAMPEEYRMKYAWARAVEWQMFPAFVAQPLVPLCYLFLSWQRTLVLVVFLNFAWNLICCKAFISVSLAAYGMLWTKLKWITMAACGAYFLVEHEWRLLILTLSTPLLLPLLGNLVIRRPTNHIQEFMLLPLGLINKQPGPAVERYLADIESAPHDR